MRHTVEIECYDIGHLYNLVFFMDEGLVKPPFFIQSIYGILGGMRPEPENLASMRKLGEILACVEAEALLVERGSDNERRRPEL